MSPDRRESLEAQLAKEFDRAADTTSRMSVLCALAVTQLRVSGAGATVLSHRGTVDGHGPGGHGPDADGRGRDPRRGLVHATNDVSAGLEDLQLTVGEGPCLDAFTTGGPILIADLVQAIDRWPGFTPDARRLGAAAVFSFPLLIGAIRVGSLDFYRDSAGSLAPHALSDALILADLATQIVINELEGHISGDASWLADPHAEVHQATGMVQVQLDSTTDTALLRLRAHAYTNELPLAEVARRVTTRQLRFSSAPDDPHDTPA